MKHFYAILAALLLAAAPAQAQTLKSLVYNTTNGQVVAATNVTFTNTVRATSAIRVGSNLDIEINGAGVSGYDSVISLEEGFFYLFGGGGSWDLNGSGFINAGAIGFLNATSAATTRTNLSIGLPALTNTSNVTMMRALAGSTNTNHPFSGTVSVTGTNSTNTLTFSNGILQSVQ